MSFPNKFRIWDSRINGFHKPVDEIVEVADGLPIVGNLHPYVLKPDGGLMITDGYHVGPLCLPLGVQFVLEQNTGIVDSKGKRIYEGDIVSFVVGREWEEVTGVQVWWCQEIAGWAFGRWTQNVELFDGEKWVPTGKTYDWWYSAADDGFDLNALAVMGNVHETPALLSHSIIK